MSHKRPATSVLASTRRSKKPKVFKKQQLSQLIADVIESVGSQSSLGSQSSHSADSDKGLEDDIEGGPTCMEAGAEAGSDAAKSLDDSLTQEAISVCKNMHAEYAKLTNVIKHQHAKISSLEKQLGIIITLLQNVNDSCAQQRQQLSQQQNQITGLQHQLVTILSLSESISCTQQNQQQQHNQLLVAGSAGSAAPATTTQNSTRGSNSCQQRGEGRDKRRGADARGDTRTAREADRLDPNVEAENDRETPDEHFTMIVHRTLGDMSRRKRNVVVTGLPEEEETGVEDVATFLEFSAAYLPVKPMLADGRCCTRIGKSSQGRPRRLLVRLHSEEAANDLLQAAPSLRHSTDDYIRTNIFINADLSPSAAKLAYEARKRRRENRLRSTATEAVDDEMDTGNTAPNSDQQLTDCRINYARRTWNNSHSGDTESTSTAADSHAVASLPRAPSSSTPVESSPGDTLRTNVTSQKMNSADGSSVAAATAAAAAVSDVTANM